MREFMRKHWRPVVFFAAIAAVATAQQYDSTGALKVGGVIDTVTEVGQINNTVLTDIVAIMGAGPSATSWMPARLTDGTAYYDGRVVTTFPDNEPFNVAQWGGSATFGGNGTTGTGSPRVTIASDNTPFGINLNLAGTAVTAGAGTVAAGTPRFTLATDAPGLFAEDTAAADAAVGRPMWGVRVDPTTTQKTSADGDYSGVAVDYVGAVSQAVHPGRFSCFVPLTATATTQCQAATAAGLRAYVTSLQCSNGAATVQGVDVVYGTGTNCGTGTTAISHKYQMGTNQLTTSPFLVSVQFGPTTPLVPNAATAICVRPTAATAFGCTLTGFVAP